MEIQKFKVKIKGLVPLLMARFPEEDWAGGQPTPLPNPPTKDEMYEKSKYKLKDGSLYQPAAHIVGAMIKAGKRVVHKGLIKYRDIVEGGVFVIPEKVPHLIQENEIDWRAAVNHNVRGGARIMVARARLEKWELEFELHCWDNRASEAKLKQVLQDAGLYVGLGAWRPRYGRFEIVSWEKVKS